MKSLACLLVLLVSFLSYGESSESLSESQSVEKQIAVNETALETGQTVLDYDSMLSIKGDLFYTVFKVYQGVAIPISLELESRFSSSFGLKWLVAVGVAPVRHFWDKGRREGSWGLYLPVSVGLRYDFQPLSFSFECGLGLPYDELAGYYAWPKGELSLGWKFLNETHVKLGLGIIGLMPFFGGSASFPLKKW